MWKFRRHFFYQILVCPMCKMQCIPSTLTHLWSFWLPFCKYLLELNNYRHRILLKTHLDHLNSLLGFKIKKEWYRALELDVQSCLSLKIRKKSNIWISCVKYLPRKPIFGLQDLYLWRNLTVCNFWPKTIIFHLGSHQMYGVG